jgi:hypothetical protein
MEHVVLLVIEYLPSGQAKHGVPGSKSSSNLPAGQSTQMPPSSPSHADPLAQHSEGDARVPFQQAVGRVAPSLQVVLH